MSGGAAGAQLAQEPATLAPPGVSHLLERRGGLDVSALDLSKLQLNGLLLGALLVEGVLDLLARLVLGGGCALRLLGQETMSSQLRL
jgi:hypothetical protein